MGKTWTNRLGRRTVQLRSTLLFAAGLLIGTTIPFFEPTAKAVSFDCDEGVSFEFDSFRRVSGTGDAAVERQWWQPTAVLYVEEPRLFLMPDDPSAPRLTISLEEQ